VVLPTRVCNDEICLLIILMPQGELVLAYMCVSLGATAKTSSNYLFGERKKRKETLCINPDLVGYQVELKKKKKLLVVIKSI
jgi:hypothetical protein